MLDELFHKVNPIDPDFPGAAPPPESLSGFPDPGPLTEDGIAREALKDNPAEDSALEIGKVLPGEDFFNVENHG